ncbi:MAG: TonB-dependent receptor [Campylobacterales bacterium]
MNIRQTLFIALPLALWANVPAQLSSIQITGSKSGAENALGGTVEPIERDTVLDLSGGGNMNTQMALDGLPSVNYTGMDGLGLLNSPNALRIRAQAGASFDHFARSIEGIPAVIESGQSGEGNLFDMENVTSMRLYKGPIPSDIGFGFGNIAGAMDIALLKPKAGTGLTLKHSTGSHGFTRTFARVDSGKIPSAGTALFISYSTADANKFKGAGNQEKQSFNFGLTQPVGDRVRFEFYGLQSSFDANPYKALTYAQSRDLDTNYDLDYGPLLGTTNATRIDYYKYQRNKMDEQYLQGKVTADLDEHSRIRLSAYDVNNKGYRTFGQIAAGQSRMNKMLLDKEQSGWIGEYEYNTDNWGAKIGYWNQTISSVPPPYGQMSYRIENDGSLTFTGWNQLNKNGDRTFLSPFVAARGDFGDWSMEAGLRHMTVGLPAITSYNKNATVNTIENYDDAIDASPGINNALSTDSSDMEVLLPNIGASYRHSPDLSFNIGYGRTYAMPWQGPLYSSFTNAANNAKFNTAGITLQDLWDDLKLETADVAEIGLDWNAGAYRVSPTLYYSKHKNKQVQAYDPAVDVSYLQSGQDATGYGLETTVSAKWSNSFSGTLSGSFNSFTLDSDLKTGSGTTAEAKGNQVPNSAKVMLKASMTYALGNLRLTPAVKHIGERYGNAENNESVDAHTLFDLSVTYTRQQLFALTDVTFGLNITNLTDQKYIGTISSNDYTTEGGASYYAGAPRTVIGYLQCAF